MRKLFIVTIDTEIDRSPDWSVSRDETFQSVLSAVPQRLAPLFDRYGVKATYLLSGEVIENDACVQCLLGLRNAEMGTHLHGDLVEPERKFYRMGGTHNHAMQCSYSEELEYLKLRTLTTLFQDRFGYPARSFRAGRFAARLHTLKSLAKLGYWVDSSVTPHVDWDYEQGRANYVGAPSQPYFPSEDNLLLPGSLRLLEVPVSIYTSWPGILYNRMAPSLLKRALGRVVNRISPVSWLRPSFSNGDKMLAVVKSLQGQTKDEELFVANMMFHSMEFVPLASPYARTEQECQFLLNRLELVFRACAEDGFEFVTQSELYPIFSGRSVGRSMASLNSTSASITVIRCGHS